MEFFERAHVTRKHSSKNENKSEAVVKKQLKQMLRAYKKGNNQEIKSYADAELIYDVDDIKSVSDVSESSFHREAESTQETVSIHGSGEPQSSTGHTSSYSNDDQSFSKSEVSESILNLNTDSLQSLIEFEEEIISQASSEMSITGKDLSSFDKSSILSEANSNDSDSTIPSSLLTATDTDSDLSDEETFDPDGALASKILEKLGKTDTKKRKVTKEETVIDKISKKEKQKKVRAEVKESLPKKEEKNNKKVPKSKGFVDTEAFDILEPTDKVDSTYINENAVLSEDHSQTDFDNSLSPQFVTVSASDMQSQSLTDIVGDYVHSTVRNLPTERQNIVYSQSSKYAILDEVMSTDNIEDVSSIIPEIDEELAIEDLTIDTDTQEEIQESTLHDDTVLTEDYFENELLEDTDPVLFPIKLYSGKNNYIFVMKHPAKLLIHGKVKVTALGGSIEVLGYTLKDESVDVYAPYCYFAHSLKTVVSRSAYHGLFSRLTSAGLSALEAEEIITTVSEHDAVISLSKLDSAKLDFVDKHFTSTELFSKRSDETPEFLKKAAENLGCSLYLDEPKRAFIEKRSWDQIVTCGMNDQSKGIICGGKGTGKSTLLRYYVNRLLTNGPVLVIDLDPGQAEFTVPGNISVSVVDMPLIGPNFTHLRKPERTLNIGMINTMDSPSRYISAVYQLISYCRSIEAYHSMPWIVNTMGMCNHMGLKFLTYIILQIQPTFVYQIDSEVAKKKFEFELHSHTIKNLYEDYIKDRLFRNVMDPYSLNYAFILGANEESLSLQKGNNFALSPKDERYLNILAYFGELTYINNKNILDIVPYEVNIRDLNIGVNVRIPSEAVTKVINGKIVALCQLTPADKGKVFTLDDNATVSHGYGLIRGIDFEKGCLYILTPVPIEQLNLVNTLVYADWMPELQGQEKELPAGTVIPYRTATVLQQRRLMFPPRRRFNPIQLLKVTRSS